MTTAVRVGVDGRVLVDRYHGIGRVTYELLDALGDHAALRFVVFVDPAVPSGRFDLSALARRPSIEVVDVAAALPSLRQFRVWPQALARQRIDVTLYPYQLGASLVGGGRRLVIVHDCAFERNPRFAPSRLVLSMYRLFTTVLLRRATVIAPSRATAEDVHDVYGVTVPADHVIGWGVADRFVAAPETQAPRPIAARYLLHVGARRPHKNVPFLMEMLAQLDDDVHLALVGSADERWADDTMATARRLGVAERVHQFDAVSDADLLALYAHAYAFVYPSLTEGFGLPLLEAMAAGLPVVASDIPVFREIAEGAAELAPLEDADAWASAVRALDDDEHRRRRIDAGRARAATATWSHAGDALATVLLAPSRRTGH